MIQDYPRGNIGLLDALGGELAATAVFGAGSRTGLCEKGGRGKAMEHPRRRRRIIIIIIVIRQEYPKDTGHVTRDTCQVTHDQFSQNWPIPSIGPNVRLLSMCVFPLRRRTEPRELEISGGRVVFGKPQGKKSSST